MEKIVMTETIPLLTAALQISAMKKLAGLVMRIHQEALLCAPRLVETLFLLAKRAVMMGQTMGKDAKLDASQETHQVGTALEELL